MLRIQGMLKRLVSVASVMAVITPVATSAWAEEEKVLNVYNWSDYIAKDTISKFEAETGIKVNYDVFDSNEVLEAKLLAGNSGYDVVVPSAPFLERQIKAKVFMPLDRGKLTNYGNLDTGLLAVLAQHDPDNGHAVPYMWGTTGIGYNINKVKERLPNGPTDSWDLIFDPEVVSKVADCGVTLLDAPSEVFASALRYLGRDPNSEAKKDLKAATDLLLKIRPHVRYFHSSQNINDLANGEICVAMGWNGDMQIAATRAAEAGQGIDIAYTIPKEGAIMWFDNMAIPSDAPHPQNAHAFLDFIMRPEIVAEITNYVFYANANKASLALVDAEITGDPGTYPSDETKANLFGLKAHGARFDRKLTRAWTKIKTGR